MTHSCFLCANDSPDKSVFGKTIRFSERFVGPPQRAHGGIAVGSLLCPARSEAKNDPWALYVSGRLHRPVPLGKDLTAEMTTGPEVDVSVQDEDGVVISGTVQFGQTDLAPESFLQGAPEHLTSHIDGMAGHVSQELSGPSLVSQSVAYGREVSTGSFVGCYGCSERAHALRHKIYRTDGDDIVSQFLPEPDHFDREGRLDPVVIAAVTDCPNLWVLMAQHEDLGRALQKEDGKIWITGTHSVHFLKVPGQHEEFRVVTRILSQEGRKGITVAALFGLDGTLYAVAEAVSILIAVPPEMM